MEPVVCEQPNREFEENMVMTDVPQPFQMGLFDCCFCTKSNLGDCLLACCCRCIVYNRVVKKTYFDSRTALRMVFYLVVFLVSKILDGLDAYWGLKHGVQKSIEYLNGYYDYDYDDDFTSSLNEKFIGSYESAAVVSLL